MQTYWVELRKHQEEQHLLVHVFCSIIHNSSRVRKELAMEQTLHCWVLPRRTLAERQQPWEIRMSLGPYQIWLAQLWHVQLPCNRVWRCRCIAIQLLEQACSEIRSPLGIIWICFMWSHSGFFLLRLAVTLHGLKLWPIILSSTWKLFNRDALNLGPCGF